MSGLFSFLVFSSLLLFFSVATTFCYFPLMLFTSPVFILVRYSLISPPYQTTSFSFIFPFPPFADPIPLHIVPSQPTILTTITPSPRFPLFYLHLSLYLLPTLSLSSIISVFSLSLSHF